MTDNNSCTGGCQGCPLSQTGEGLSEWSAAHDQAAASAPRGWTLLAGAFAAFVLPVVGAFLGAYWGGPGELHRFAGLAIGLAGGGAAGSLASRLAGRFISIAKPPCSDIFKEQQV